MVEAENALVKKIENRKPKLLLRLCYSLVVAIILFVVLIGIIAAELIIKILT